MDIKKTLIIIVIALIIIITLITTPILRKPIPSNLTKLPYIDKFMEPIDVYYVLGEELNLDCINNTGPLCFDLPNKANSVFCDSLQDNDERLKCKFDIEFDPKYCNEITDQDLKNTCLFYTTNNIENCKEIKDDSKKNLCFAIFYNSVDYCKKIIDSDFKNLCFYKLTGDITYCQKIMGLCGLNQNCKNFEKCFVKKVKNFAYSYGSHHFCKYFMNPYNMGICMKNSREI